MTLADYDILTAEGPVALVRLVRGRIKEGWEVWGSVVVELRVQGESRFHQMVFKKAEKPPGKAAKRLVDQ